MEHAIELHEPISSGCKTRRALIHQAQPAPDAADGRCCPMTVLTTFFAVAVPVAERWSFIQDERARLELNRSWSYFRSVSDGRATPCLLCLCFAYCARRRAVTYVRSREK